MKKFIKKRYIIIALAVVVAIGGVLVISSYMRNSGYIIPSRSCLTCGSSYRSDDASKEKETAYHKITAEEAKNMIDGNANDLIIIDVRTAEEYAEGHIPNAISIPNNSIDKTPPEQLTDKNASLLIYCRSGVRSMEASNKLVDMGYAKVYDFGGIIDWPYEIEK